MKSTKKIKAIPTYACKLGKGMFMGQNFMCIKCGKQVRWNQTPDPRMGGSCPDTNSGNHVWQPC